MKIQSKVFGKIIFNFKGILFRNRDIISGEELVECDIVSKDTKNILNRKVGRRFKRDHIYFVVFKLSNGISYTVELSREQGNQYFPRSLKINDTSVTDCREIDLRLINKIRFKPVKARKVKWPS